jgi:hypothetical protein
MSLNTRFMMENGPLTLDMKFRGGSLDKVNLFTINNTFCPTLYSTMHTHFEEGIATKHADDDGEPKVYKNSCG